MSRNRSRWSRLPLSMLLFLAFGATHASYKVAAFIQPNKGIQT